MEIYIVHFMTGEYSDRSERVDKVFADKGKAEAYVTEMGHELDKLGLHDGGDDRNVHDHDFRDDPEVLEKFGHIDYTGGRYYLAGPFAVE